MPTKIEWAQESWNPITGCSPISEGCKNCYAKRMAQRLRGRYGYPEDDPFQVVLHSDDKLFQPLKWFKWKKPREIFVCSMGDLFHEDVPTSWISDVWEIMELCPQHTFLILTKRPERMKDVFISHMTSKNIWPGVSAENQKRADERIPVLLEIPGRHFVSLEPCLGPVDISNYLGPQRFYPVSGEIEQGLDGVILGGESGPGARPMHPNWARNVRDQCVAASVPFFFKQWGEWVYPNQMTEDTYTEVDNAINLGNIACQPWRVGKKKADRLLDGWEWNELPWRNRADS